MPLYKCIISTDDQLKNENEVTDSTNKNLDVGLTANKRMVNAIRHLSQLARAANDIFGGIDLECRNLIQRTTILAVKIQKCQSIVDQLDAKTVKIPISSLTGNQESRTAYKSCDEKDLGRSPIFCTFPRPPEVERLRRLANGPSPPVHIPCNKVDLETDGDPGTTSQATHIYCKPLQIPEYQKHKAKSPENQEKSSSNMTSSVKMPSSVVPIDVSGQTFSRMASFRRSLIHVDFFIRKKKKDKRRNTVAEGDSKELKNALQNIINEEHRTVPNGTLPGKLISNGVHKSGIEHNIIKKVAIHETNNNFSKDSSDKESLKKNCPEEQDKIQNGNVKAEQKNSHYSDVVKSYINKRKPKSHIPISTISAAMNVAVEMRQRNGIDNHSSSSDHSSSDFDNRKTGDKEKDIFTTNGEDSGFSDNFKHRAKENSKTLKQTASEDIASFSSASSENNTMQDEESSNATSLESDAFLMSSDESDEDSSELMVQKYGSSTSLSTMSEGSLNSLLSQTGTEMASSTGTLTSIGQERFPTPPPPPPPFVMVAPKKEIVPVFPKTNVKSLSSKSPPKQNTSIKTSKKGTSPKKPKSEKPDQRKSSTDSNKSIFTSLVNKKSRAKEQRKDVHTKSTMTQPCFDMYGNNSPQKVSRSVIFVKENIQPLSETEPVSHFKSFLPNNNAKIEAEIDSKKKNMSNLVNKETLSTIPDCNTNSDISPEKIHVEVPLKYAHHVTVTPISRQDENYKYFCRKSLFPENDSQSDSEKTLKSHYCNQPKEDISLKNTTCHLQKPQRPRTLQTGPKTAARVVLDPDGRVIYSTNSLDRRQPYGYPNQYPSTTNVNEKCMHSPSPVNMFENINPQISFKPQSSYLHEKAHVYPTYCDKNIKRVNNFSTFNTNVHSKSADNSGLSGTSSSNSTPNHQNHCYNHISGTGKRTLTTESKTTVPNSSEKSPRSKSTPPSYEEAVGRHCPHIVIDPNVSGLPTVKTMLTEENINLHLENIERLNKMHLESIADSYKSLISPQTNISSPLDSNLSKLQKSTMSTEDLFAVIHDCKKRMNIKTDSDISLGSSSRSSSPLFLKSNQTRGILAETGFLSPRNSSNFNDCRDRRSWADFRPASTSPNERKSLASDRLGRTKPTSMHDFKMLLLQARGSTQISGPRKSAVEMLKISPSPKSTNGDILSSHNSHYKQSFSVQNSPTSPSYIHNGHSTVPFKRHNNRVRSSLQSRYTMYPPIFEDCSEEGEIKSENTTKTFT